MDPTNFTESGLCNKSSTICYIKKQQRSINITHAIVKKRKESVRGINISLIKKEHEKKEKGNGKVMTAHRKQFSVARWHVVTWMSDFDSDFDYRLAPSDEREWMYKKLLHHPGYAQEHEHALTWMFA